MALNNFRQALTRSKVGQSLADQRALATAIDNMRIDTDVLLVDIWDDDTPEGEGRLVGTFGRVGWRDPHAPQRGKRSLTSVLAPLTTPIMYISRIPRDPFALDPREGFSEFDESPRLPGNQVYLYADQDPDIRNMAGPNQCCDYAPHRLFPGNDEAQLLEENQYALIGLGPNNDGVAGPLRELSRRGVPYDPSNGIGSPGQIVYRSRLR